MIATSFNFPNKDCDVLDGPDLFKVQIKEPEQELPQDPHPPGWMYGDLKSHPVVEEKDVEEVIEEFDRAKHAYLDKPFVHFTDLKPMVARVENYQQEIQTPPTEEPVVETVEPSRAAAPHPGSKKNFESALQADNVPVPIGDGVNSDFGNQFPPDASKGDVYLRTDYLPNRLFKFNGVKWIEVDKEQTDTYAYNEKYIWHLIDQIDQGKYDPDILTDVERTQIAEQLEKGKNAQ